jgi:hypothetical protein
MAGGISGGFDSLLKKQKVSKKLSHEKKNPFFIQSTLDKK